MAADQPESASTRDEHDQPRGYFIGECDCECPIWPNGRISVCECVTVLSGGEAS